MSGRSAYVRKKITEPRTDKHGRTRSRSSTSTSASDHHADLAPIGPSAMPDFPMPAGPVGTGVGTTNARFLKFSHPRAAEPAPVMGSAAAYYPQSPATSSGPSSASVAGGHPRRDNYNYACAAAAGSGSGSGSGHAHNHSRPLDEHAYARARKPTIKTEDVSGIEKSGLRSILDRRTDSVRKNLAKTFTFKRKDTDHVRSIVDRPPSASTVRPDVYPPETDHMYDDFAPTPALQMQQQHVHDHQLRFGFHQQQQHQHQQHPATSPNDIWDVSVMAPPPPASKLPPIPPGPSAPPIKRWIGAGRPVARWNKLRKDPELWDPNGDVLIFLGHKGQSPRPLPSFRLSSHIIEATESRYLVTLLREGSTEEDIHMPPSPSGAPPPLLHGLRGVHRTGAPHLGLGRGGQPTPPTSEDASLADGQISYEMHFPTPSGLNKTDSLRHQLTTRNVFALLYHASLVGLSLYQALADLHTRLDRYMPHESDNVGQIINYLSARGIDDVRSEPETAVSLLAWSEGSEVRWEEGWRETFTHCAGMYADLESCADFKSTAPITRALLERACLETQLRVQAAEERLADLAYTDMWSPSASSPAREAAERLGEMLRAHYADIYGTWPPPVTARSRPPSAEGRDSNGGEETWLSRTVAADLQRDFGALYDYLVDRDVVWDESEARAGRKWVMASESGKRAFEADAPQLPMTDMLIEFDNKPRFPHIPHPYPLIPDSVPPTTSPGGARDGSGMFKSSRRAAAPDAKAGTGGRGGAIERRVHLAYTESTNIYALGSDFAQSDLIEAFVKFEKADRVGEVDPAMARRGRWVLIYGVLQTLASVSVDAPGVRFRDGVPYHLGPRLRGAKVPPWRGIAAGVHGEASHELSHCWVAPRAWVSGHQTSSGGEESSGSRSGSPVTAVGSGALGLGSAAGGGGAGARGSVVGYADVSASRPQRRSNPRMWSSREQLSSREWVESPLGTLDEKSLPVRRRDLGSTSSAGTASVLGAPTPVPPGLNAPIPSSYLGVADLSSSGPRSRRAGGDDYEETRTGLSHDRIRDFDAEFDDPL